MRLECIFVAAALQLLIPAFTYGQSSTPSSSANGKAWAALQLLARRHGISQLTSVRRAVPDTPDEIEAELLRLGINYCFQDPGPQRTATLRYAAREGLGAVVGFRPLQAGGAKHYVVVTEFTNDSVTIIDPNHADRRPRTMPMDRFRGWWDGFALVLVPDQPVDSNTFDSISSRK